jgi:hypothetical protein
MRGIGFVRGSFYIVAMAALACGSPMSAPKVAQRTGATSAEVSTSAANASPAGALIQMELDTQVGVLLDEVPAGAKREEAARRALAQPASFWRARAQDQLLLTNYRLVFRSGFYKTAKGPLPLPPKEAWNITMTGAATRANIGTHDFVAIPYHFNSMLVTDASSPALVEPRLAKINGTWNESFDLPADPELLLERTGYACMDENEFPPGAVFEEAVHYYYDQTCGVETPATSSCHITVFPTESCERALNKHVGKVSPNLQFTRIAYDAATAAQYRVGALVNPNGADLAVVEDDMIDENRILYRYFDAASCEIGEGAIAQPGWRRLLTFSASVRNDGTQPLHIGDPTDPANPWVKSNVFEFSACHHHYHFSHYGNFSYNGSPGTKRAFCLEDTNRFHNDERTPLTAEHQSCNFQGIGAGWGDEYNFGLPGQWVDITDVDASSPHDLTFDSNPDQFLCEGQTLDASNNPVDPHDLANIAFDPTSAVDAAGNTVSRIRCAFAANWSGDNHGSTRIASAKGSFVTEPCARGQQGPLRSCGFGVDAQLSSCTPGATVNLSCSTSGSQVVRVCERSAALGGVACTLKDSLANSIAAGNNTSISFTCPSVRDGAAAAAGGYSLYSGALLPWEKAEPVHCAAAR